MKHFSWFDLSGEHPDDWDFAEAAHVPGYFGAQLAGPWLGPEDEAGRAFSVMMLRHPDASGGSIETWFKRNVIDTGIDRKNGESRQFAGAPAYWLVPKPGHEDIDLVIYAEFEGHIYQFRFIGLESEERLAPDKPLTLVLRSMKFGA